MRIYTAKHFHQRGFTCTILTAQGMNFTFPDLEIDVFQCFDARKGFGDALHFQMIPVMGLAPFHYYFSPISSLV